MVELSQCDYAMQEFRLPSLLSIRLVGSHLWSIFCYAIHQWRSRRGDRDTLHHQQQALLRNSSSVTSTLWLWLKITFAHCGRYTSDRCFWYRRNFQFAYHGIEQLGATKKRLLRLPLQSMATNVLDNANKTVLQAQTAYDINTRRELKGSLAYAQSCCSGPSPLCRQYIVESLPQTTINFNASCPFGEALCLTQAIQIDNRVHRLSCSPRHRCAGERPSLISQNDFLRRTEHGWIRRLSRVNITPHIRTTTRPASFMDRTTWLARTIRSRSAIILTMAGTISGMIFRK